MDSYAPLISSKEDSQSLNNNRNSPTPSQSSIETPNHNTPNPNISSLMLDTNTDLTSAVTEYVSGQLIVFTAKVYTILQGTKNLQI